MFEQRHSCDKSRQKNRQLEFGIDEQVHDGNVA
jgi:hypothetical protein